MTPKGFGRNRRTSVWHFISSVTHSEPSGLTVSGEAHCRALVGQAPGLSMNDRQDACPTKMAGEVDMCTRSSDTGLGICRRIYDKDLLRIQAPGGAGLWSGS